ncbi:MAG TPA: hypothetical protein VNV85_14325 [Puia sp.]|jgi:hypothetical protein|nr:hypothetical protein [Puia sp.]
MFAAACATAREFTFPIIISTQNHKGECNAGIGAFVVINEEGWIVTAFHIINQIQDCHNSNNEYKNLLKKRKDLEENMTMKKHDRMHQLNQLKIQPHMIVNFSILTGWEGVGIAEVHCIPAIDLAVGRLINFDKKYVRKYPIFKDPSKPMEQGASLCKLGFPFHIIKPIFEKDKGFVLPAGSFPPPIFPIEGIYTRTVNIQTDAATTFPLMYIETSSPGLRGQSGGPTVDIQGTIWAIQSQTQHFKLGFGGNDKGSSKEIEHLQNQYLNVGWGIHAQTIISLLREKSVYFSLSTY